MKKIARFEKVSFNQFKKDCIKCFGETDDNSLSVIYNEICLPKRATQGSAGHDFYMPIEVTLKPHETVLIPTGIRCYMEEGWVLKNYPRSSLGFKYRIQLNNTVGIIDQDYYMAENEGHILSKITNDTNENKAVTLDKGMAFMQGIFIEYGICYDDITTANRSGGIGSTDN